MSFIKCPECGNKLTQEMLDANMCWECGKILDETLLDTESLEEISKQAEEQNPFHKPEIKNHKMTTGYSFQGYNITDYIGLVSGEIVVGTGFLSDLKAGISDLLGTQSMTYSNKLKEAKKVALYDMITDSIKNGGNAIIGISYSYITFSGNMIGIAVNGTAVKIEKTS